MKRKTNILKVTAIFTAFALGIACLTSHFSKAPIRVEAAQHINNYGNYTYTGTYYQDKNIDLNATGGMNGALRVSLTNKNAPVAFTTYGGYEVGDNLSTHLQKADEDPDNSSNMIYFYTRDSVTKTAANADANTIIWNREHVWPKTLSNGNWEGDTKGKQKAGTDMLHLRPTYGYTNNSRGNKPFGDNNKAGENVYEGMTYGYSANLPNFEPIDSVKGDVARIIMYVWTTYTGYSGYSSIDIEDVFDSYNTLIKWHTIDKPDVLEGNRNNYVESSKQKNRNPFVDHPELAWKIFGEKVTDSSILDNCVATYPADGSTSTDPTGITLNQTSLSLTVGGTSTLTATLQPNGATGSISWLTSNSSVATVTSGVVTATGAGTATITAKYSESIKATCTVTVTSNGGQTGNYVKVASYKFNSVTASNTEYSDANLLLRFNSSVLTGNGLSNIVNSVSETSKVYPAYSNYESLGIKFGTSSVGGSFTLALTQNVVRVVVKAAGWGTTDKLAVGGAAAQAPGVAYSESNALQELTFDITSSNSVQFSFTKRGFIQSIDFYAEGEAPITPYTYLASATKIATIHGTESVGESQEFTSSVTFSSFMTNSQVLPETAIGQVTLIGALGTHTNTKPTYYTNGSALRLYKGNTLTLSSTDYKITKIIVSFASGYNSNLTANTGTFSSNTWMGNGKEVVFNVTDATRITSISVTYVSESSITVTNIALRFGIKIPTGDWGAIVDNDDWTIQDYGVMMFLTSSLTNVPTVQSRYEASASNVAVGHRDAGTTPAPDGLGNYNFTVRVNIPDTLPTQQGFGYASYFCVRPFVKISNQIYWLLDSDIQESINTITLPGHNSGTNLSEDALEYLQTAH